MARAGYKVVTVDGTDTGFKSISGWSAEETAGANPVQIYLRNSSVAGDKVIRIRLAAGENVNMDYFKDRQFPDSCVIDFVGTGTAEITVHGNP